MVKIEFSNKNENPFFGLKNCLKLFQNHVVSDGILDACWEEVQDDKEKRKMFFSLLFSIGDITSRQHNIFKGVKKDSGGNSERESFYEIFLWIKNNHPHQFVEFLTAGLFNEYTCFDLLF